MARLDLVRPEDMNKEQKAQYDRFPSNLTRALVLADQRLSEALPNLANALRAAPLDAKLREGVILRVAALHASAYERRQHLDQAKKYGWSDDDVAAIERGEPPAEIADLLRFTDEVVRTGAATDATFDAVKAQLPPRDVATVLLLIGHYMMVARYTKVLQVAPDAQADSWSHEH